jgi:hypothetical protein
VRALGLVVALVLTLGAEAFAQGASGTGPPDDSPPSWSGTVSLFTYVVPDEDNFVQPTAGLDRDWLHLEARFNYEDLETVSGWIGRSFNVGERVALEITPMGGVVVGNTDGVAVGYSGSLTWRRLDLSSETEYVFATGDADSFLYTWSELGWSLAGWLRAGLSVQRTKVYETAFDIQRGVFGTFAFGRWEMSAYVFNPDSTPTVVLGVAVGF